MTMENAIHRKLQEDALKVMTDSLTKGGNSHCASQNMAETLTLDAIMEAKNRLSKHKDPIVELAERNGADLSKGDRMVIPYVIFAENPEWRDNLPDGVTASPFADKVLIIFSQNSEHRHADHENSK